MMPTALATELFPDHCEVVHIPLHNQWVYLIYKNGNSSLKDQQVKNNLAVFINDEIRSLDSVDVYIRESRSRYISGVNTYLQFLQRDHPELDYATAFWFAKQYKFLNRHYMPQFHWIANLSRFMHTNAKIRFRDFKNFSTITEFNSKPEGVTSPTEDFAKQLLHNDANIELWLYLDQILLELAGQEMTWTELQSYYLQNFPQLAKHVLSPT